MKGLASIARSGAMACLWCTAAAAQSTTVNVQILNQVNPQVGVNGRLQLAMSTSFQLAGGIYQLFGLGLLENLFPHDTRVQVVSGGLPLSAPDTWNFSISVAKDWEAEFFTTFTPRTRKVALRSAMTMGPGRGGIFDVLLRMVRFGLGGRIGSGRSTDSGSLHQLPGIRCHRLLADLARHHPVRRV